MMELAVALLMIITFGGYFFYLKKLAHKEFKPPYTNAEINPRRVQTEPKVTRQVVASKPKLAKTKLAEPKNLYKCVVIKAGASSCQAAKDLADHPILQNEAPILPLATCDSSNCSCKFIKKEDRRSDDRREILKTAREIMGAALNRRERTDRRKA